MRAAHGLRGAVRADIITDFSDRFDPGSTLWLGDPPEPRTVESSSISGGSVLLKLSGVDDRDAADALRGAALLVPCDASEPLEPDSYHWHQLVGLDVWTDAGERLGALTEILRMPANDVLVVCSGKTELWLPATREVMLEVDVEARRMVVHVLPGLR